jgi:hypothetical protein
MEKGANRPPSPWLPLAPFYSGILVPFYSGVDIYVLTLIIRTEHQVHHRLRHALEGQIRSTRLAFTRHPARRSRAVMRR